MKIKVCGITNNRNLIDIGLLYPDYMGFIFHEGSPRDITGSIEKLQLGAIPPSVKKVAVFVDKPVDEVRMIIKKYRFDAVQLHGDEEPGYCGELMSECEVIKTFRIAGSLPENLSRYENHCNLFLFDAKGRYYGGNGLKFNHRLLEMYDNRTGYILSGGIGDKDIDYLKELDLKGLQGIDLNSRFEISPGYKSSTSLRVFMQNLRSNAKSN